MSRVSLILGVALLCPLLASAQEPAQAPAAELAPATATQAPATAATQAPTTAPTTAPATTQALASDDPSKAAEAQKPVDPASIKVERTSTGAKLFRITEGLVVEGQMQKPHPGGSGGSTASARRATTAEVGAE